MILSRTPRLIPEKADFRPALALRFLPGANGTHMTTMSYGEQLKHPFWQRKRLEVLNAAEFHCENCGDGESTLHVHHKRYVKGRMAWEYEAHELAALCDGCHQEAHRITELIGLLLANTDPDGPWSLNGCLTLLAGWLTERVERRKLEKPLAAYLDVHNPELHLGRSARAFYDVFPRLISLQDLVVLGILRTDKYRDRLQVLLEEAKADVLADASTRPVA